MPTPEQLVAFVIRQYRWGLHPIKLLVALLLPIIVVWVADRHVRRRAEALTTREAELKRLPRTRRRH